MGKRLTLEDFKNRYGKNFSPHVELIATRVVERVPGERFSVGVVLCKIHGEQEACIGFLQYTRVGCPLCGKAARGSRVKAEITNENCRIYVVIVEVFGIQSIKVGITKNAVDTRLGKDVSQVLIDELLPEWDAALIEGMVHKSQTFIAQRDESIRKEAQTWGTSWGGQAECYRLEARENICIFVKSIIEACKNRDSWVG